MIRREILLSGLAAAIFAAGATPAAARITMLDDQPAALRDMVGAGGLDQSDNIAQLETDPPVLPTGQQVARITSDAIVGLDVRGMASVLRQAVEESGSHRVFIDDVGVSFRGASGDRLAAALGLLGSRTAPGGATTVARRVNLYMSPDLSSTLTETSARGIRLAMQRAGGVWLKTSGPATVWSFNQWLTWPAATVRLLSSAKGGLALRAHLVLSAGDQVAIWALARHGSACDVLGNGPAAYRVGASARAFAIEHKRTFTAPEAKKQPPAGCTPAPVLPTDGAAALVTSWGRETTGLPIPPGGLVTPPLVAGEPAQVTLQLGADPLGLAAGLGVTPEAAWKALAVVVQVRGPGVALDAPIAGDGSAALAFTPTAPGPVSMRIVVQGSGVSTALGAPSDLVQPLASTPFGAPLLSRVVTDPDHWTLTIPLVPTDGSVGDPVLVIVPPFG
ncbi:MAG: hypothetical protein AB7O78_08300 [Thermoleophilia bacterium]